MPVDNDSAMSNAQSIYAKQFNGSPAAAASAPGRVELLGNHTDHQGGAVLSTAIPLRTTAVIGPSPDGQCHLISSADSTPISFDLAAVDQTAGNWGDYVRGVCAALAQQDIELQPFCCAIDSRVPSGSGLSSSAALEMAIALALASFIKFELDPLDLARIGQTAENQTVGAQTGLMDQLTSRVAEPGHIVLSEYQSFTWQSVPMPRNWSLVVIDSGVRHDNTGPYNQRRAELAKAIETIRQQKPELAYLCDLTPSELNQISASHNQTQTRRARHVVAENERVKQVCAHLSEGQIKSLGQAMFESHTSSRDDFENSHPILDAIIEAATADSRCIGARLSGGGFGGNTVHLVRTSEASDYSEETCQKLTKSGLTGIRSWVCAPSNGAKIESFL